MKCGFNGRNSGTDSAKTTGGHYGAARSAPISNGQRFLLFFKFIKIFRALIERESCGFLTGHHRHIIVLYVKRLMNNNNNEKLVNNFFFVMEETNGLHFPFNFHRG